MDVNEPKPKEVIQGVCNSRLVRLLSHHWLTPLALVPFVGMLAVHRILGLSDEINTPMPGNRLTPFYNVALVLAFYGGVMAYSIHTILMAYRGWGWVIVKAAVLAVGWTAMLVALGGC